LAIASDKYYFIGSDNGLLSPFLDELESFICIEGDCQPLFQEGNLTHLPGARHLWTGSRMGLARGTNYRCLGDETNYPERISIPSPVVVEGGQIMIKERSGF
jgi:S-adenosylmethionine hydrolase